MPKPNSPLNTPLRDLSKRLIGILIALGAWFCLSYIFKEQVFSFWTRPLAAALPDGSTFLHAGLRPETMIFVKLIFFTAFFPALPFILYHLWRFFENGPIRKKTTRIFPFLFWPTLVFIFGAVLAYFVLLPPIARLILAFATGTPQTHMIVETFLALAEKFTLAFGLSCALPVIFYFLGREGVAGYCDLSRSRRYTGFFIFSVSALFTPPDLMTLWMLGVPLVVVCELCFQAVRISEKKPITASPESVLAPDTLRTRSRYVLTLFALVVLCLAFVDGFPSLGMGEIVCLALLPFLFEYIHVLFVAFRSSVIQGFLCFLIPFYAPYFVLGKGSLFFRGRRFTKVWAGFTCLTTLYGILRLSGIV